MAAVMVVAMVAVPLAGCQPTPPVTRELKVGIMSPSTGVAAEKGAPMGHGNLDAFQYINNELGGVGGVKITPMWYDTTYNADKVVTLTKRLMDEGALFTIIASSTEANYARATANPAGFPILATFTAPILYRPPQHVYGQMPDYGDGWSTFTNYYLKNLWKGTGKPKMALMLLSNPTGYGARDAATALAAQMGVEIVATEEHAATTTSEIESLTRIKAKNPDVIFISSTPAPSAVIVRNARDLGLFPQIPIALGHAGMTQAFISAATAQVAEGVYGVYPTVLWDDNVPGMAKAVEYAKKNNPKDYGNADYLTSWAASLIGTEIVKLAVQNAGYDVLAKGNADSWKAVETQGFQKLNNYTVGGLHGPVSYTAGDNRLDKYMKLYQVKSGKIAPISDWIEAPVIKYEDFPWFGK